MPHNITGMDHKKYHQIQNQIKEARQALQNWNDRRAEAMIELDSIFTDIEAYKKEVSADQAASASLIAELKTNLEKSDRDFHKHFEVYTNDLQELKLENENLSRQLKEALNEVEKQKQAQKKMEVEHQSKIAQVAAETEVRVADQQYQLKTQVTNLVAELQSIQSERKSLSVKADQYEKELRAIRTQMMSFLNVTKEVAGAEVMAPIVVAANAIENAKADAAVTRNSTVNSTAKKSNKLKEASIIVDNMGNTPATVNDYLKKFGY